MFAVSQIEVSTGSAESQRRAQMISGAVGKLGGIVAAGMAGGAVGAAVAAGMVVVEGVVDSVYKGIEVENRKRLENESLYLRRSRLGMAINRSRTGGVS